MLATSQLGGAIVAYTHAYPAVPEQAPLTYDLNKLRLIACPSFPCLPLDSLLVGASDIGCFGLRVLGLHQAGLVTSSAGGWAGLPQSR